MGHKLFVLYGVSGNAFDFEVCSGKLNNLQTVNESESDLETSSNIVRITKI